MADSHAQRQARYKRHRQGDHSLCKHDRVPLKIAPVPAGSGQNLDPTAALRDLAVQLGAAYSADSSNALLARELRMTLQALSPSRDGAVDAELQTLMSELSRPVPRSETTNWLDDSS